MIFRPVSYTHLDVYKRQVKIRASSRVVFTLKMATKRLLTATAVDHGLMARREVSYIVTATYYNSGRARLL